MRLTKASLLSSVYCVPSVLALSAASLFSESAAAGCDLTTHLAKLNAAKVSVAGIVATAPSATAEWSGPENPAVTGYYLVLTLYQGSIVDERFDNWFADHNELFIDQSPPPTGYVCNGTWVQSGRSEYKLMHKAWIFDSTNTFVIGTLGIRDTITLSKDRESFTGTEINTVYDANGNVLAVYGPFDLQGTRLRVDF